MTTRDTIAVWLAGWTCLLSFFLDGLGAAGLLLAGAAVVSLVLRAPNR